MIKVWPLVTCPVLITSHITTVVIVATVYTGQWLILTPCHQCQLHAAPTSTRLYCRMYYMMTPLFDNCIQNVAGLEFSRFQWIKKKSREKTLKNWRSWPKSWRPCTKVTGWGQTYLVNTGSSWPTSVHTVNGHDTTILKTQTHSDVGWCLIFRWAK